jgi:hypothetical protein
MNVTGCVPLAGQGLVARRGGLVALSDGLDAGPDPLLAALAAVAEAAGDGAALVLAGTRAALERGGRPSWACAGVTFGGEVAVLVHGDAVALVSTGGGPEAEVTASGSMIPVVRTFTGPEVTVRLAIGPPAAADPRLWLDGGTVYGGGLLLTVTQEASHGLIRNDPRASAAVTAPAAVEAAAEDTVSRRSSGPPPADSAPAFPLPAGAVPEPGLPDSMLPGSLAPDAAFSGAAPEAEAEYQPGYEPTMLAGPSVREVPPPPGAAPAGAQPQDDAFDPGYEPTMLAGTAARQPDSPGAGPAAVAEPSFTQAFPDDPFASPAVPFNGGAPDPDSESWFRTDAQAQVSGPTTRLTQSDVSGVSGMTEPPIADIATMELVQLGAAEPVLVDGTMCARMHFNPPDALFCRECGMSMHELTPNMRRQPRPPLGVLLVDDGRGFTLDRDYVIGREPVLDGDVAAGRATPLRISDPKGTVSRLHLRVSLVGWQVEVRDLGSANGSVLYRQGGPRTLAPLDAAVLDPGARVGVGRRTVQFLPYGATPLGVTPYGATS